MGEYESFSGMEQIDQKFQDMQHGYRKAISIQDDQLVKEKESLMKAFKDLASQLQELKRTHQNYAHESSEKDKLIDRLKEAKMALDHELEQLTQENQQLRDSNHKLTTQNTELRTELNAAKNQVSKVEVQLESSLK